MADKEQLEILKQGVQAWNNWRKKNPDVKVDLVEADLAGADLRGASLRKACLQGADLTGANLWSANLWEANLRGAQLSDAKLTQVSFRESNLRGAVLMRADLSGSELRRADLSGANLRQARLVETELGLSTLVRTDLREASLTMASLWRADLKSADLQEAHLVGARLQEASLLKADLRKADLTRAYLWDADLRGADFTETVLTRSRTGDTVFGDNDLSLSIGLETVVHRGPSFIGMDTIRRSKGKIPVAFLRGCGLRDAEIEFAKLAAPGLDPEQIVQIVYEIHRLYGDQPIQFYSCFISYNSRDQSFARRLHDDLQNNGVRCWFAPEDMKIGDELRKAIGKEIRVRDKLLIILSENSIRSEWVGDEVEKALAEEKEQGALKLFPIRLDNAVFETKDDWAEKIRLRRHIGDFSSDYDQAFQRLLRDLKPQ